MNMNIEEKLIDNTELVSITCFFDLLASFDYEDKRKSGINTDLIDSAPMRSVLGSDNK